MRFKINYDSEQYTEALKQNKEKFIQEHELEDNELAITLVYAIPIVLTESDVATFKLLLDVYERYIQIKSMLDKQGIIVMSSTGTMMMNKLLNAERQQGQHLLQLLRSFGCTADTKIGLETKNLTNETSEQDPVLKLLSELKN